jgi:predicted helicase
MRRPDDIRTAADLAKALASIATGLRGRMRLILSERAAGRALQAGRGESGLGSPGDLEALADAYAQITVYGLLCARLTGGQVRELLAILPQVAGRDGADWLDRVEVCVAAVSDVLDGLGGRLDDIVRGRGGSRAGEDPVIHLYEAFLAAYDPQLRQARGVYYTPRPVVRFIVRAIDEVLRGEFGLAGGLADTTTWGEFVALRPQASVPDGVGPSEPFVRILDPATGTGTFLVEVIDLIHERLWTETWAGRSGLEKARLWASWVPEHLLPRLCGFELMVAPCAVAHMNIALKLQETGYELGGTGLGGLMHAVRARIVRANALTPPRQAEAAPGGDGAPAGEAAAGAFKRAPFTVVLGNPPFAGHSSNNDVPEIVESVGEYRRGWPDLNKPGQGKWLQDDYVKFFRLAETTLRAVSSGVLGFVSNHGWLDNPTFKGMRASLKATYGRIDVVDLHGNLNKREASPDGSPDENVFGSIAQGIAVVVARRGTSTCTVRRCDIYGREADKLAVLGKARLGMLRFADCASDEEPFAFVLRGDRPDFYQGFASLASIFGEGGDPAPGIVTTHDQFAISFTPQEQAGKIERFLSTRHEGAARALFDLCTQSQWSYRRAKADLEGGRWRAHLRPIRYRPFDVRWTVYASSVAVHRRDRVSRHLLLSGNVALLTSRQTKDRWGVAAADTLAAHKSISAYDISYVFPLWLHEEHGGWRPNLAAAFTSRIEGLTGLRFDGAGAPGRGEDRGDLVATFGPGDVFDWIYAVLHSPAYRQRHAEALKADFARVPLPRDRAVMAELVRLGRRLLALHLLDGNEAPDLRDPSAQFAGPGETRVDRGFPRRQADGRVHVNARRWVEPVSEGAWSHWFGGYQPAQKWLKDRAARGGRRPAAGPILSAEDELHYRRLLAALEETPRAMAEIDRVIDRHGGWPQAFGSMADGGG